jgi:hypothetical protein
MGGLASWTDVCSVGRNIHQLLLTEQRPAARRAETNSTASCSMADGATARTVNTPVLFGQFSHGAAHSFFGGSEGTELLRSWRLHSPARCIDKIKSHLIGEMQGAEWEMLQEKEWSDFGEANGAEEEAVLVKGRRYSNSRKAEAKTAKSGSGWTRLRQRASEEQSNMKSSSNATSSRSDLQ